MFSADAFIAFIYRCRFLLALSSIALVVFSVLGLQHFSFDASPRSYFKPGHPPFERFAAYEETYGRDFRIVMMLSAKQDNMFRADHLQAIIDATEQAWLMTGVRRVDSVSNYQHTFTDDDELIVEDLFPQAVLQQPQQLLQRQAIALNDASLRNRLISPDGKHAAIIMSLNVDADARDLHNAVIEQSYALEAQLEQQYPDIYISQTGNLMSNYHNILIAIQDVSLMMPLMFALMFILIGGLLKSVYSVLVSLIVAMLGGISALGLGAWFGIEYSMLAINALIISITITVAHCIHIFTQLFVELREHAKAQAIQRSLSINLFAVSMTSLTTMVGFLSLNFNDLPPAVALGNAAAIGTFLSWLFSLTLLPCLVSILPFKAHRSSENRLENLMLALGDWVIAHQRKVLLVMIIATIAAVFLSFSNRLNDRFSEMIHEPHIFRSDTNNIDQHFGALYTANYDLDAGEAYGIAEPAYLMHLDRFAEFLRAQPEIKSVYSFADVVKRLNQTMHNGDPQFYRIPENRALIAQYILMYEMSLPFGLDLNDQLTLDKSRSRLVISMPSIDTQQLIAIEQRINAWQAENLPSNMQHLGASMSIIWAHLSEDSLSSSLKGSVVALTIISMILLLVLRSVRYGVISLIPNLMPAAFGFAAWYIYKGEIGLGLTCVVIITIGIVVDDTVHFLSKYKKALHQNHFNSEAAIRSTFQQVGPALVITTLVLSSGFWILSLSKIVANSALGGVTAMILIAAFVLDVLLLPALLLEIDKAKNKL